jgi:hypothetical protein
MAGPYLCPAYGPNDGPTRAARMCRVGGSNYVEAGHRAFFLREVELLKLVEIVVKQAVEKRTVPAGSLHSGVDGWSEGVSFGGV